MRDLSFLWKWFRWPWRSMLAATLVVLLRFGLLEWLSPMGPPISCYLLVWFFFFSAFLLFRLDAERNDFTQLKNIEKLCEGPCGIYKRIDENRERLDFLQKNSRVVKEFPFLEGWIPENDCFYRKLQQILKLPEKDFRGGTNWPRDWPRKSTYFR